MHVLFVFAHQDDELAFASRIRFAASRGDRVTCVCLTDGASNATAAIRDDESRRVLALLGGGELRVADPAQRIPDGALPERLDDALRFLESAVPHADEVVTLAYEGGHQDHDAAHLVAAVYARERNVRCLEMPLYNRHHAVGPFFRVLHPLGDGWSARPVARRERIANVLLARHYPSQRRSWLGLAPQMLLGRARELTRAVDLARTAARPHRGVLLYERRFRYPYSRFAALAEDFLRRRAALD